MRRNPLLRSVFAAVLVLGLLLPVAASAQGPVLRTVSRSARAMPSVSLWDLVRQFLGQTPHLKNGWGIDPDGAAVPLIPAHTDNNWTIDPNG
jgi:hypothetical protein